MKKDKNYKKNYEKNKIFTQKMLDNKYSIGGAETWLELLDLIDEPLWEEALADFGEIYGLDETQRVARLAPEFAEAHWGFDTWFTALIAFAAVRHDDTAAVQRVWRLLLTNETKRYDVTRPMTPQSTDDLHTLRPFSEVPWINTNHISQWCLNVIECLELVGDQIPEELNQISVCFRNPGCRTE